MLNSISAVFQSAQAELSAGSSTRSPIAETVLHLAQIGVTALVSPSTGADDKDPDTVIVSVSAPYRIGLPAKELYENDKLLSRYQSVLSTVISELFPEQKFDNETFESVVAFEHKLARASPDAQDRNDVTVSDLSQIKYMNIA